MVEEATGIFSSNFLWLLGRESRTSSHFPQECEVEIATLKRVRNFGGVLVLITYYN